MKRISKYYLKGEKREVHDLEDLIYSFEEQQDSYTNSSLPLSIIHKTKKDRQMFSDLSNYIAKIEGDFVIHLVTSNHFVFLFIKLLIIMLILTVMLPLFAV